MKPDVISRFQHVVGPVVSVCLLVYFVYHIIQGDRGILAWRRLQQQISVAETKLNTVKQEQDSLERNVRLMRPDSLDSDMLEEQAKEKLNFVHKDEVIIRDDELG